MLHEERYTHDFTDQATSRSEGMGGRLPRCQRCRMGELIPLSDCGPGGAALTYKAWVCTNPECGFNLKMRKGTIVADEPITSRARSAPSSGLARAEQPLPAPGRQAIEPAPVYRVGALYDAAQPVSPTDGEAFSYRHGRFELALMLVNPRSAEVRDVRAGQAQFALFIERSIVVLLSAFGDSIDWGPSPLRLQVDEESGGSLPPAPESGGMDGLVVLLVDASSRVVRVVREVPLTADVTQALRRGVHQEAAWLQEPGAYQRVVEQLEERYPTDADLVAAAVARWTDAGEAAGKPWRR